MGSWLKEDEKNERIIRGLLKLPENRRCINCNSLGPQYVCTNFWTFVCTTCSGIHREFTHRVKSVSMAKFTSLEVAALQQGGNQRARDAYLKEWDSQRQTGPDGSNVGRLRDFIKHVYVDRRYTGEKGSGKHPSTKIGDKEDSYDNRRSDTYQGGSRSPPYEDTYDRRRSEMSSPGARSENSRYSYDERRSPGYDQESRHYNDFRRSPANIVTDWRREDRFGNGLQSEDQRVSDGDPKLDSRSPERAKEFSSPPAVRPVREILGDNVVPLRVIEPPKPNVTRAANGSSLPQRSASSSSLSSINEKSVEVKLESTKSLIDFDTDPEPEAVVAPQPVTQPASTTNDNNWASFDFAPQVQVSQAPPSANPLESDLLQLSVPPSLPNQMPVAPGVAVSSFPPYQTGKISAVTPTQQSSMPVNGGQWPNVLQHQQPSLFPASSVQPTPQQYRPAFNGASGNQLQNMVVPTPNMQAAFGMPPSGVSSVVPTPAPSGGLSQTEETKSTGRKELPADLFATTFSPYHATMPGWQIGPPRAMGYGMQYPVASPLMPTFIHQSMSVNPFDAGDPTRAPAPAHSFPPMDTLQGALPNIQPSSGLQHTAGLGAPLPAWMPPQSSLYPAALPSQPHSYASAVPPRTQGVKQQLPPTNMPLAAHQVAVGSSFGGAAFVSGHVDQHQPFPSLGGNPFG